MTRPECIIAARRTKGVDVSVGAPCVLPVGVPAVYLVVGDTVRKAS